MKDEDLLKVFALALQQLAQEANEEAHLALCERAEDLLEVSANSRSDEQLEELDNLVYEGLIYALEEYEPVSRAEALIQAAAKTQSV